MNILLTTLITLVMGLFVFILILLNEHKKEIWEEVYKYFKE